MIEQTAPTTRHEGRQLLALLNAAEAQLLDFSARDALNQAHALLTLAIPLAARVALALPD